MLTETSPDCHDFQKKFCFKQYNKPLQPKTYWAFLYELDHGEITINKPSTHQTAWGIHNEPTEVMMNLVTGVFVDGAQRIAREEKNQVPFARCAPPRKRWGFQGSFQNPFRKVCFFFKILDRKIGGLEWLLFKFCDMFQCGLQCYRQHVHWGWKIFLIDPEPFRRLPKPLNHRIFARNCWSMCADCLRRRRDSWLVLDGLTQFEQA